MEKHEPITAHLAPHPKISIMGVEYLHLQLEDGSDLYLTEYGRPFAKQLLPQNHLADPEWFAAHSTLLPGTGTTYRIATKPVAGHSKDIVLKWNRMGQDIPGETESWDLATAQFNSPFEEFSLVIEMRNSRRASSDRILTHKPLAIFVPRKYVEAERMGRKPYVINAVQKKHKEVTLDLNRQYAVIYEWVKGVDAAEAFKAGRIEKDTMTNLIVSANQTMMDKGFVVWDNKPHHIIIRPTPQNQVARDRNGQILYALIDFELLERTPQYEQMIRAAKRKNYLVRQAQRFNPSRRFPPDLKQTSIMGVDYVYGQVESTGGRLWVVGKDPLLFEYFLPEKWRKMPRTHSDAAPKTYHTVTKDDIHLVWRVSNVGKTPIAENNAESKQILEHGYNSPFEEISISLELAAKGIAATYPRAIYMTGHNINTPDNPADDRRHQTHAELKTSDEHQILDKYHDYIIIWGYWNAPDETLAQKDEAIYKAINALDALEQGFISQDMFLRVDQAMNERLAAAGFENLSPKRNHLLLSIDKTGQLLTNEQGLPIARLCDFEMLRRIG